MHRSRVAVLVTLCALGSYACGNDSATPTAPSLELGSLSAITGKGKAAKVDVCHLDDSGLFKFINVNGNALSAHLGHGDGQPGGPVPGSSSDVFGPACQLVVVVPDADGDGVPDADDAFPNDPSESADSDGDGVGDNADVCPGSDDGIDGDGDGIPDGCDCDFGAPQPARELLDARAYEGTTVQRAFNFSVSRPECGCGEAVIEPQSPDFVHVTDVALVGATACVVSYEVSIPLSFEGTRVIHTLGGPHEVIAFRTVGR